MVAAIIAVAGVAASAYGASEASSNARDANRNAGRAAADQATVDRERLDFSREQYSDWQNMFQPIASDLRDMAYQEQTPDYGAISADVGGAFDTSRDINTRNMQRMGVRPTDGAQQAADTAYGLGRAGALVDTRNRARTAARDTKFNRLSSLYAMGNGLQSNASNMVNAAYAGASGSAGQRAGMYNSNAQNYQQQANQGWNDAMGFAGWGYGQSRGGP